MSGCCCSSVAAGPGADVLAGGDVDHRGGDAGDEVGEARRRRVGAGLQRRPAAPEDESARTRRARLRLARTLPARDGTKASGMVGTPFTGAGSGAGSRWRVARILARPFASRPGRPRRPPPDDGRATSARDKGRSRRGGVSGGSARPAPTPRAANARPPRRSRPGSRSGGAGGRLPHLAPGTGPRAPPQPRGRGRARSGGRACARGWSVRVPSYCGLGAVGEAGGCWAREAAPAGGRGGRCARSEPAAF